MIRLTVRVNGTNQNPFEYWGLTQNPFPQVGKTELMGLQKRLASLGGLPIQNAADIRERLKGFGPEFIEGSSSVIVRAIWSRSILHFRSSSN